MSQEITTTSWGGRIKNAFFGLLFGLILIIASFYFIFWNEATGLHTAQSLDQTAQVLVSVPNSPINPQNNLKVVYFNGEAVTTETLTDNVLGISANAIRLNRNVDMYQWKEEEKSETTHNVGGSETTTKTYSYYKTWSPTVIHSDDFHDRAGHENPSQMLIAPDSQQAQIVTVGDFNLPTILINKISGDIAVDLANVDISALQTQLNKTVLRQSNYSLYVGANPQQPQIGDLRITMTKVLPQMVSVIAEQSGNTLQAYMAPAGKSIALLATGIQSSQQLIHTAQVENQINTWLIRLATLVGMIVGFLLILRPVVILADIVPFFGTLMGFGTGFVAFVVGLSLWAIATAIAWFTVRPLMSLLLIVIIGLVIFIAHTINKRRKASGVVQ